MRVHAADGNSHSCRSALSAIVLAATGLAIAAAFTPCAHAKPAPAAHTPADGYTSDGFDEWPSPVIAKVAPKYPLDAIRAGLGGTVILHVLVDTTGIVRDVRVVKSVPGLDEAAVEAVRQWKFRPAISDDGPVAVWVTVPFRFDPATAGPNSPQTDVDSNHNGIPDQFERIPFNDFIVTRGTVPPGVKANVFPLPAAGQTMTVAVHHPPAVRVLRIRVEVGNAEPLIAEAPTPSERGTFVDFNLPGGAAGDSVRIAIDLERAALGKTMVLARGGPPGAGSIEALPEAVERVAPEYPPAARSKGVSGTVMVQALVGTDGLVKDVRVLRSTPELDEAAMACVRMWTFKPATANGRPVATWVAVPIRFTVK